MKRRTVIAIPVALGFLMLSPFTWTQKQPRSASSKDAQGVWLGYTKSGEFYRVELRPDGGGTVAVALQSSISSIYEIKKWSLSEDWRLSIVGRGVGEFMGENIFIDGSLQDTPARMTIGSRNGLSRELMLSNEQVLLDQSRLTREQVKTLSAQ